MDMPLTADRFIAQLPGGIRHDAIEEHPLLHGGQVLLAPDVHHDGIDVFRPIAIRVAKALADAVELAELRAFIEAVRPQPEALIHRQRRNIESGVKIKFHGVFPLLMMSVCVILDTESLLAAKTKQHGSVRCEGGKGAIANFVCFHCPLVASAGAKSPA